MLVPSEVNPNIKVYKWVKTAKVQQFSDDEGEIDEPLAPLPDEPEIAEGDEEMDQEEPASAAEPENVAKDMAGREAEAPDDMPSKAPSPKPTLTMDTDSAQSTLAIPDADLGPSLRPPSTGMDTLEVGDETGKGAPLELNISELGPDGVALSGSHDLSQIQGPIDSLAGGMAMDQSGDPFAPIPES